MDLIKTIKKLYYGEDGKFVSEINSCLAKLYQIKDMVEVTDALRGFPNAAFPPKIDAVLSKRKEYKKLKKENPQDKQLPTLSREVKTACSEAAGILNTDISLLCQKVNDLQSEYNSKINAINDFSKTLKNLSNLVATKAQKP